MVARPIFVVMRMNLRMRITDLFRSKKIRSTSLVAVAAISWLVGSGIPEAFVTEGQGVVASAGWVESVYADPPQKAGETPAKPAAQAEKKDGAE